MRDRMLGCFWLEVLGCGGVVYIGFNMYIYAFPIILTSYDMKKLSDFQLKSTSEGQCIA